jgi:hypothetical protein
MKKLALFTLALMVSAACSRRGEVGPPGPVGPAGPAGPGQFTIIDFEIAPPDWLQFGNPGEDDFQYFIEFDLPEMDQSNYENALVLGYLDENGTKYTLPNTLNFDGFTREYSFYYGVPYVGFVIKDSDLQTTPPTGTLFYEIFIVDPLAKKSQMEDWTAEQMHEFAAENPEKVIRVTRSLKIK